MSSKPSVFDKNDRYTELALEVERECLPFIRQVFNKYKDRVSPREIEYLISKVAMDEALEILITPLIKDK